MIEYFEGLSTGFYAGVGVFIAFIMFLASIYTGATSEEVRERHKSFLQFKLEKFSEIKLEKTGQLSAKLVTACINRFLCSPNNYRINDPVFWRYRSIICFLIATSIFSWLSLSEWAGDGDQAYFLALPIIIFTNSVFVHAIVKKRLFYKELEKHGKWIDRDVYDVFVREFYKRYDVSSLSVSIVLYSGFFFVLLFFFEDSSSKPFHIKYNFALMFSRYYIYILFGLLSLYISRLLIYKLSISKDVISSVNILSLSLISLVIFFLIADFLSLNIYNSIFIEINHAEMHQKYGAVDDGLSVIHKYMLILVVLLPMVLFYLVALVEVLFRLILNPLKKVVAFTFERLLNYNLHIYIFSSIFILAVTASASFLG